MGTMSELYSKELKGHLLAGGCISALCIIRSEVLVGCANQISSYSIKTGNLLHVLDCNSSTITGIAMSPSNSHQLLSTTACGFLTQWDMTDWRLMKRVKLGDHISHLLVSNNSVYIVVRENENNKIVSTIKEICPSSLTCKSNALIIRKQCDNFTISRGGSHILYTRHNMLRVLSTDSCVTFTRYTAENKLVSAAIHSSGHMAAVGDMKGKITILKDWNIKGSEDSVSHHWHANSVGGLSFASHSEALFSGGREAVLVKWFEGEPQFLPRLGCSIEGVLCAPKGDTVISVLGDSTLAVINLNTWAVRCRIVNVIRDSVSHLRDSVSHQSVIRDSVSHQSGLLYDPISRGVIFGAMAGELQVFDPVSRRHLKILDICQQNKTSGQIANKSIVHTQITHFKITHDGVWLVTLERRDDGYITPECRLKYWRMVESTRVYELCTNVDPPHTKEVTSLTLSTTQSHYTAITTSNDCTAKVWQCPIDHIEELYKEWSMVQWCMVQSLTHCNGASHCSAISSDGTVLAVAYSYIVVLYNTSDWSIIGDIQYEVKYISQVFISGYYLLVVSKDLISSYNLTSLTLCYEVKSSTQHVLMIDNTFLAFVSRANQTDAYLFTSSSSQPIIMHKAVCPGTIVGACCADDLIVILTSQHILYSLSVTPPHQFITQSSVTQCDSVFSDMLGHVSEESVNEESVVARRQCKDALNIISTSSHAIPVMSSICKMVLTDLLPLKQ